LPLDSKGLIDISTVVKKVMAAHFEAPCALLVMMDLWVSQWQLLIVVRWIVKQSIRAEMLSHWGLSAEHW